MRISDWSSDVCSSDLVHLRAARSAQRLAIDNIREASRRRSAHIILASANTPAKIRKVERGCAVANTPDCSDSVKEIAIFTAANSQSEEHTSELQSLMRISYAVFCLKKKKPN